MDTGRAMLMLDVLAPELRYTQTVLLHAERTFGENYASHDAMTASFRQHIANAPSSHFVPSWLRMAEELGLREYLARPLLTDLLTMIEQERASEAAPSAALMGKRFRAARENLLAAVQRIERFPGFGRYREQLRPDSCEIGILFPRAQIADFESLANQVRRADRHLRTFTELSGTSSSLRLSGLATGSYDLFAVTDLVTGGAIVTALITVVKNWKIYQEARKLSAETAKLASESRKLAAEAEKLERENREAVALSASRHAAELRTDTAQELVRSSSVEDANRGNELVVAVEMAMKYIEMQASKGVIVEVRVASGAEEQVHPVDYETYKLILRQGGVMAEIDEHHAQLSLPEAGA